MNNAQRGLYPVLLIEGTFKGNTMIDGLAKEVIYWGSRRFDLKADPENDFIKGILCGDIIRRLKPFIDEDALAKMSWQPDNLMQLYIDFEKANNCVPGYRFILAGERTIKAIKTPDGLVTVG